MTGRKVDVTKLLAFDVVVRRALAGDERVLRIARKKALEGSLSAEWLLREVDRLGATGARE